MPVLVNPSRFTVAGGGATGGSDTFAAAGVITLPTGVTVWTESFGTNAALTTETSEPAPTADSRSLGKTAWWQFTPAANGWVSVDTIGSSGDTEIAVYTGSAVASLTKVASDSDTGGGSFTSWIKLLAVTAGTTYHIQVSAWTAATMNYVLNVRWYSDPTNDNFANATVVTIPTTGATYTDGWLYNTNLTTEGSEPAGTGIGPASSKNKSAWWTYTPASSGSCQFDAIGTRNTGGVDTDCELVLWTGSSLGALVNVGQDSDSGGSLTPKLTFSVTGGVTYHIQLGTVSNHLMAYQLNVTGRAT